MEQRDRNMFAGGKGVSQWRGRHRIDVRTIFCPEPAHNWQDRC